MIVPVPRFRRALLLGAAVSMSAAAALAEPRPKEDELFGGKPEPPKPALAPPAASGSAAAPAPAPGGSAPGGAPPSALPSAPPPGAGRGEAEPPAAAAPAPLAATGAPPPPSPANQGAATDARDSAILGGKETAMFTEEAAPSDPLRIGGQLYLRTQMTALSGQRFEDYSFSAPSLADVYFDARPNDRVRGFILGRMFYDPTLPPTAGAPVGTGMLPVTGGTSGSANLSSLFAPATRAPSVFLDQLWLRFDVAHTVFVTAGKQHVRWGTGHFWTPTDFLHLRPRNPLDVFDARTGTSMIKLHVPIESKAWNFYAYGVTENVDATQTLSHIAGAARAELVFDAAELGVGAFVRRDEDPKVAADLSVGIGDFDVYGEVALKNASDIDRVRYDPNAMPDPAAIANAMAGDIRGLAGAYYPVYREHGYHPQAVGGLSYAHKYNDNDTFTIGAEYFYNGLGYDGTSSYLGLVLPHTPDLSQPATFFYLGRHYGALYATFPAPFSLDLHTFTLSTLANFSDQSFITRLDYSLVLLTHLRFEAFASARYGNPEGEFRFGLNPTTFGSSTISRAPAIFDLGLALRLAI